MSTHFTERAVQTLVSQRRRELWQQKVWIWGTWHLHKGINEKIKRTIDNKPKTRWRILFPGSKKIFCLKNHKGFRVSNLSKSCTFQSHYYWLKNTIICIVALRLSSSTLLDWCCCWWGIGTYGSVSAGREKWPFNVLFFLKAEPLEL